MKKSLLFVFLLGIFYSGFSQGTWSIKNAFPGAGRLTAVAFSIGTKGYLGTGHIISGYTDDFWEYDPATDTWTQKANFLGGGRHFAVGFSIGNKGYIGTGQDNSGIYYNDFWEYDPATNVWTKKADLPGYARTCAAAFSVNGFGYLGTGNGSTIQYLDDVWKYDPSLDLWTQMNNFPGGARSDIDRATFVIGNKAYWGLGFGHMALYIDLWEYDPLNDTWTQKANFPSGSQRYGATGFSICNLGFLGLGVGNYSAFLNDFWMYNPATNLWNAVASYPGGGRCDAPAFVISNKAYVGTGDGTTSYFNDWAEFTYCKPATHFVSSDTAFCNEGGQCIDFTDHSTNNPISWQWFFPGATPDTSTQQNPTSICYYTPGTYAVTLIVSNSNGSDSLTVSPMIMFATSAAPPVLTRSNDTIFCSHAAAYQWYFNGSPIANAIDSFYVITGDGVYAVQITDANGCTRLSDGFTVSVNELSGSGGIKIYPNPAGDQFIIYGSRFMIGKNALIEIYNVLGEKVLQSEIKNPKSEINIFSFAKGIYFVEVSDGSKIYRAKFLKD